MVTKEELHRLVDELPQGELGAARRYLEYLRNMGDPVLRGLMQAPLDDEPQEDWERSAVTEAYADIAADRITGHDEDDTMTPEQIFALRLAMGLTQAQFPRQLHVSTPTVSRWECGATKPVQGALARLTPLAKRFLKPT